jgi:D-alanyl-D-alanine carboxypeptidase
MTSRIKRRAAAAAFGGLLVMVFAACAAQPASPSGPTSASSVPATPPVPATPSAGASPSLQVDKPKSFFNRKLNSIDDPSSIWVVVDKLRPLKPVNFVPQLVTLAVPHVSPPQMTPEAGAALLKMFAAAASEGAGAMQDQNSYRSYAQQVRTHNYYVTTIGDVRADAQSARPGYSEHQTGLAIDIAAYPSKCDVSACFGQLPQGVWLAKNSWRFGYILRYPAEKTAITGYIYEPWHYRYVGVVLSTEMHATGVTTLEEFFGLPAAADYAG